MNSDIAEVLAAAVARADALAGHDAASLRDLLHPQFVWTSHTGERFDLGSYLESNRRGSITWFGQRLVEPQVTVISDCAILVCLAQDLVDIGSGQRETFMMPMTQTWVRAETARRRCLAGHAGPRSVRSSNA